MEHVFPMIDLKATGRRIKELREQRGISVRQLQTFLGFEQPQAIYKWQRGECLPTFDNMYAMACFFHVKVDEILVGNRQDFDIKEFSFFFRINAAGCWMKEMGLAPIWCKDRILLSFVPLVEIIEPLALKGVIAERAKNI